MYFNLLDCGIFHSINAGCISGGLVCIGCVIGLTSFVLSNDNVGDTIDNLRFIAGGINSGGNVVGNGMPVK